MTKKNKSIGRDELLIRLLDHFPNAVAIKALNESDFYVKPYTDNCLSDEITGTMQEIVSDLPYTCEKTADRDPFFMEDNDLHPEYILKYKASDDKKLANSFFYENSMEWEETIFIVNYFLESYDKVAIKLLASGELYVKPYHTELTPEEIENKVLADLAHKKLDIMITKMDPPFINDLEDFPEFMIDFN